MTSDPVSQDTDSGEGDKGAALDEWARSRPTRCPDSGGPLYRAIDVHVVVCWDDGCHRDFVVADHNDYLLAAPHYAGAITNGLRQDTANA